jgi:hypothetical protein
MPAEAQVEHVPLSKRRLLEYLEAQKAPVTAKAASIDLDTRASTATEMLERCAAQGLVQRAENQRPREYGISGAGRTRLEYFRSSQGESNPQSTADPESNPGSEEEREDAGAADVGELKEEVARQFDGLREDMRNLFEVLNVRPAAGEGSRGRVERIKHMLESLAEQGKADAQSESIRKLYFARYELRSLGWGHGNEKPRVEARIAELEGQVGKETVEQIARLVTLEERICDGDWSVGPRVLREVLELREALHLPASVFGRGPKSSETETAEK